MHKTNGAIVAMNRRKGLTPPCGSFCVRIQTILQWRDIVTYLMPRSMDAAFAALGDGGATVVAGGTDWFPAMGDRLPTLTVLDITALPGFRGIIRQNGMIRIGAATTWTDLIAATLPAAFDGLKAAAREVGSVQIQNAATIAGNLCNASPAADGVPPLLTLDARVELVSVKGRRELPLDQFILGPRRTALQPGELLAAVLVPDPAASSHSAFLKAGARRYMVISIASAAAVLGLERGHVTSARVAVGACSAVAIRLAGLEYALAGCPVAAMPAVTAEHLSGLAPLSDLRGSADYRLQIAAVLVSRVLAMAVGQAEGHGAGPPEVPEIPRNPQPLSHGRGARYRTAGAPLSGLAEGAAVVRLWSGHPMQHAERRLPNPVAMQHGGGQNG